MINNDQKPKKINRWKRFFWSWDKLVNYFEDFYKINEFQRQKIEEGLISDLKLKLVDHFEKQIKKLQKTDNDFLELKNKNDELKLEIKELKKKENNFIIDEQRTNELKKQIDNLTKTNNEYYSWKAQINKNIIYNTQIMNKIENIFLRSPKQIGNFGEKGIEQIFEQCGIEKKFWTKNLTIDNNIVEFAFRLNDNEEKWIPIDVKTFPSFKPNENNEINFDDLIVTIELEAKKIKKYLNCENTERIGIMIIPDDGLYLEISRRYVKKIKEIFTNYGVVVASTSIFLQWCYILWFSFALSKKFHNDQKFHEDVNNLMLSIKSFINDIIDIRKIFDDLQRKFHLVQDRHYTKTKKQYEELLNKLQLKEDEKYDLKSDIVKK